VTVVKTEVMLGTSGRQLAGVVVSPETPRIRYPTLVCLPGASYGRDYWDLQIPESIATEGGSTKPNEYSFAEYAATKGFVVVALDPLGVGASDRPAELPCTLDRVVAAGAEALTDIRGQLSYGSLCVGLSAIPEPSVVLMGHSTGAILALIQQARFGGCDAVSLLGLNFVQMAQRLASVESVARADSTSAGEARIRSLYGSAWRGLDTIDKMDKNLMDLDFFHGRAGDPRIRSFDATHSVSWPARPIVEGFDNIPTMRDLAVKIKVPLFLGYGEGELDGLPPPHSNAAWFPNTQDLTLYVTPGAYHCHNFSDGRHELWRRICDWAASVGGHSLALKSNET
jgi:pimeloyl-ACP methyl ester carboxylesterase